MCRLPEVNVRNLELRLDPAGSLCRRQKVLVGDQCVAVGAHERQTHGVLDGFANVGRVRSRVSQASRFQSMRFAPGRPAEGPDAILEQRAVTSYHAPRE